MRNLIDFILRNIAWFVFIILELICFYFIFSNNSYQRSVYVNSSNELVGRVYSISGEVNSYFGLKKQNQDLLDKNAQLQRDILNMKEFIQEHCLDSTRAKSFIDNPIAQDGNYDIKIARVINNSINQVRNFIVVNKGRNDGIDTDYGVISEQGVVGLVRAVSDNYAIVQPILNPDSKINGKSIKTNTTGTLVWEGKDPRYGTLIDYPKYEKVVKGDTIVTSGYSHFFPEGVLIGTVEKIEAQQNDNNFVTLTVLLSTDFASLKDVLLIKNKLGQEIRGLENEIKNAKK